MIDLFTWGMTRIQLSEPAQLSVGPNHVAPLAEGKVLGAASRPAAHAAERVATVPLDRHRARGVPTAPGRVSLCAQPLPILPGELG